MEATPPLPASDRVNGQQSRFQAKCDRVARLFSAGLIDELVSIFYATNAVLEGKGLPPQIGIPAIAKTFKDVRTLYRSMEINLDIVTIVGTVAYGTQTNFNTRIDGHVENHRGLIIWQNINHDWLVVSDFFYTDQDTDLLMASFAFRDK